MSGMKLTLDALQVLDAITRRGSFAAAAAELNRVPSALTYSVQKLEQDLDVLLYDRRDHRAQLTAAGADLLEEGRQLLRAAGELECRVKRGAAGWETELRIVVGTIIAVPRLFALVEAFYAEQSSTRLRINQEVLAGTWDALASNRADLAHRAVALGDTSRHLATRSVGLLTGQDVLTVPDMATKVAAQVAGPGCGYLPAGVAVPLAMQGKLVIKEVADTKPLGNLYYAWRNDHRGKALRWFLKRLEDEAVRAALLEPA